MKKDKQKPEKVIKHPAVFSDQFIKIFHHELKDCHCVLDPFAGTGKLSLIKNMGFNGLVICNDLEPEYKDIIKYPVDEWIHEDAATITIKNIDAIATSPTYGNRMADSHNAQDDSKRITYTHQLGRKLDSENTGAMQWGERYKQKHIDCYKNFYKLLPAGGKLIINISDHIRKGSIVNVSEWTKSLILSIGFKLTNTYEIPVKRMRFGQNANLRVEFEYIFVFTKVADQSPLSNETKVLESVKSKRDIISKIPINVGNLKYISETGVINGSLLSDIEKAMETYASQFKNTDAVKVIKDVISELDADIKNNGNFPDYYKAKISILNHVLKLIQP